MINLQSISSLEELEVNEVELRKALFRYLSNNPSSQKVIANQLGVTQPTISRMLYGKPVGTINRLKIFKFLTSKN